MKYRELVLYGVYTDLRTEVAKRFLGFLWWVIEPVMYMTVFYLVFGLGLRQGDADYVPFLLTGMVVWKWFDSSLRQCSVVIAQNAGLIQQIFIPKYVLALIQVLGNTFKFLIILLLLLALLVAMGKAPSVEWLALVPLVITQFFLTIALGLFLMAVVPFAQDLKLVIDNLLLMMMFMSGIFFSMDTLPEAVRQYLALNPMVGLIESYRQVLLDNQWPDTIALFKVILTAMPFLAAALLLLKKFERRYPKMML